MIYSSGTNDRDLIQILFDLNKKKVGRYTLNCDDKEESQPLTLTWKHLDFSFESNIPVEYLQQKSSSG